MDMAADRGAFICQSQSLNLFVSSANLSTNRLSSMHFYAWRQGLKTGMYYLRSQAAVDGVKMTIAARKHDKRKPAPAEEECLSCSA